MAKWRTNKQRLQVTVEQALAWLEEGNRRFQANVRANRDLAQEVRDTANGQRPFAAVLTCIDSRTPPEVLFDQGLGDLFAVRLAGNVINDDVLASLEFACCVAGARLIVVLGHSRCGAVTGAYDAVELGHLPVLFSKIRPAIEAVKMQADLERDEAIEKAIEQHAEMTAETICERSSVLRQAVERREVGIVSAVYSVASGKVRFSSLRCGAQAAGTGAG